VAAGGRDGVPGRDHPGALEPAEVDGLLEGDVEQQAPGLHEQAQVAHGGEPGLQRAPGVGHRPQGAQGRVVLHRVERAAMVRPAQQQVDLHVHQARQQGEVAQVDHRGVAGHR
jgi:hypothetical protein